MDQYDMNDNINISDVIEVIENTDPGFAEGTARCQDEVLNMMSGGGAETVKPMPLIGTGRISPYVEIIEQPASKALRFRYECEGRSAGSIPGIHSTPENKTFPSIRIVGYKGRAVVVVSCVTKDPPYRPHPHNLVGKEACKRGVCTAEISSENMTMTFAGLGIQCVKKKDIEEALRVREEIRVDPFRTGFDHKRQPTNIDLNAVRMCFQVFIQGSEKGKFTVPLPSVVSDPIYDKKAMSDLVICKLSHCSASIAGGMEMMLLCEKVAKEDIQVRFFEERDGQVVWEGMADFQPSHVHKQVAIAFRTPTYCNQQIDQPVQVYIQLKRPSDHATSDALPFQMVPLGADDPDTLKRKRQKFNNSPSSLLMRHIQTDVDQHTGLRKSPIQYNFNLVKPEPMDTMLYGGGITVGCSSPLHCPSSPGQNLRPMCSPGNRTPSPSCMTYHVGTQQQPQQNLMYQEQLPLPHTSPNFQLPVVTFKNEPIVLEQVIPDPQESIRLQQQLVDADEGVSSVLNLDSNQFSFDMNQLSSLNQLNSAELAVLGTALSDNFSSGLSISDTNKTNPVKELSGDTPMNIGESNNSMTDSFTRLTNTTIQELCTLNSLYNPTKDNRE